ncbi:hypothetical protein, partial [Paenibacillus sp. GXUN7292]|uniref:hypothetical protein n=1 Tax=Paenibacillus sp. GXUN7292 TaxID=3422499 RepID=UPI003D7C84EE
HIPLYVFKWGTFCDLWINNGTSVTLPPQNYAFGRNNGTTDHLAKLSITYNYTMKRVYRRKLQKEQPRHAPRYYFNRLELSEEFLYSKVTGSAKLRPTFVRLPL